MTNEELAIGIQEGNTELYNDLWERLKGIIYRECNRYFANRFETCVKAGIDSDDLSQEGYFALIDAVNAYKPEGKYKFTSYLSYPLKNRFNAVVGFRTAEGRGYLKTTRLDTVIDDENLTLGDTIPDERAEFDFKEAEERIFTKQLHNDLETCIATLDAPQEAAIRAKYYYNEPIPGASGIENKALRRLRMGPNVRRLRPYEEYIISRHAFLSSYGLWKYSGYSSTEYAAMKLCF